MFNDKSRMQKGYDLCENERPITANRRLFTKVLNIGTKNFDRNRQ